MLMVPLQDLVSEHVSTLSACKWTREHPKDCKYTTQPYTYMHGHANKANKNGTANLDRLHDIK